MRPAFPCVPAGKPGKKRRSTQAYWLRWDASCFPKRRQGKTPVTIGRDEEITQAASCLLRKDEARLLLIAGPPGTGKTNLIHGVAARLAGREPAWTAVLLDLARVFSGTPFEQRTGKTCLLPSLKRGSPMPKPFYFSNIWTLRLHETPHGALLLAQALDARARGSALTLISAPEKAGAARGFWHGAYRCSSLWNPDRKRRCASSAINFKPLRKAMKFPLTKTWRPPLSPLRWGCQAAFPQKRCPCFTRPPPARP